MSTATTPSKLEKIMRAGHFGITSECGPPRSTDGKIVEEKANMVGPYVDGINVTYNQTAVVRCHHPVYRHLSACPYRVQRKLGRLLTRHDQLGREKHLLEVFPCLNGKPVLFQLVREPDPAATAHGLG